MKTNAKLLITGGTGSFGKAVLKEFLPKNIFDEIRVFSRDEKKQDDLRKEINDDRVSFFIRDVRDVEAVKDAMSGIDYVFHAAALKQVPSCEFFPIEAVKTNVLGTENIINAAIQCGVEKVVVLSTDKAVYPINAMGMSKAMMEKVAIAKARNLRAKGPTITITRYGNVMGSRGSVIPLFAKQLNQGQPLTITNPKMTRFMMSLNDAVNLVWYALEKGEQGDLFVQKAPATNIQTLAEAVAAYLGKNPEIKVIGTRHGEKLYESLLHKEDMIKAEDLGDYYRVPMDDRGLNYEKYFSSGEVQLEEVQDYHSHNTQQLDLEQMVELLKSINITEE